jgi:hypothetical protein
MRTPDQYRELAAWCYHLAQQAKTEEHQKILREIGAFGEVAEELETKIAQQRSGAKDCGQRGKAAGAFGEAVRIAPWRLSRVVAPSELSPAPRVHLG